MTFWKSPFDQPFGMIITGIGIMEFIKSKMWSSSEKKIIVVCDEENYESRS